MRKTVTAFVASLFCASAFAGLTQTEKDVFNTIVRDDINGAYNVDQTVTFAMAAGGTDPIYQDVDVIEREFQLNPPGTLASVRRGGMAEKTAKCEAYVKRGSLI